MAAWAEQAGAEQAGAEPAGDRQGPRPLPLHLAIASTTWLGSAAGLPIWRNGWPGWSPSLLPTANELRRLASQLEPNDLAAGVAAETRRRYAQLVRGVELYRRHPYRRTLAPPPTAWREGTTRLLDYRPPGGGGDGPVALVVPSLINRAYILDFAEQRSLMRYLAALGVRCLLVEWNAPGAEERRFDLTDYIAGRLGRALDQALALAAGPVAVIGYCMGGLLALALAQRRRQDVAGIACLATPWDFHAERAAQARLIGQLGQSFEPVLRQHGALPVDVIQALFAAVDPLQVVRKFMAFAALDPASTKAAQFVALEDWVNDGVPLAAPVARQCFGDWYGANLSASGAWLVAGEPILPRQIGRPALVVLPDNDRIVPPASAAALVAAMPGCDQLRPAAGHIGMIVGGGAVAATYRPLADWLQAIPAAPAATAGRLRRGSRGTKSISQMRRRVREKPASSPRATHSSRKGNRR